jgi:hypothetical protein
MIWSDHYLLLAVALSVVIVAGVVLTAPSLSEGLRRLKLISNSLGLFLVVATALSGTIMLVWGLVAGSKELIYLSLIPLVGAFLFYEMITRQYRTWYGLLGFNDKKERWESFWSETVGLWRSELRQQSPGDPAQSRSASKPVGDVPTATGGRGFSFSFGMDKTGAKLLGPLVRLAAHQLSSERISVFPDVLQICIVLPTEGEKDRSYLESFFHQLTVRSHGGAPLRISVDTDLPFLEVVAGPPRADGCHTVDVRLLPHRLRRGPFSGTISIHTDDPDQPRLTVPVVGRIE